MHALKLALNKSMCASAAEQGINKLWPYDLFNQLGTYISSFKLFLKGKADKDILKSSRLVEFLDLQKSF